MLKPVPIVGGSGSDECQPWCDQDTCNWLPVSAYMEGARSGAIARTPPGLKPYASISGVSRQRGGYVAEGRLLFVADETLYQLMPDGSLDVLGTVPGTTRCSFSHNKVGTNIEVFIGAGSWGGIYSSASNTLTQITDEGFHGAKVTGYIGHLFLAVSPSGKEFQNSALDDGLNWNALETYEGESKPDRIVSLAVANGEVVLLNERSLDHFAYTGETNALFQNKLIPIDRGCGAANAVSLLDNALFFIGDDGSAYEKRGYELRRITTHAIEQEWALCDIAKAYSFVWEDKGHKVWYVTFPDGKTWGYDIASRLWHRRESYGMDRWRLAWLVKWEGEWYGGEFNTGRIFKLVWKYVLEGTDRLVRKRVSGVLHDNQNRLTLHTVEVVVEASGPATVAEAVFTLAITNGLPDYAVGDVVDFQYASIGGAAPFVWTITGGALPTGLTMDDQGRVTGTCTVADDDFAWQVTVTGATGQVDTKDDESYVLDMLGDPPDGVPLAAYSYTLTGSKGMAPYTFSLAAGSLNPGLTLASDGEISGTPTIDSSATFSVRIVDDEGVDQVKQYTVSVAQDFSFFPFVLYGTNSSVYSTYASPLTKSSGIAQSADTYSLMGVGGDFHVRNALSIPGGSVFAYKFNRATAVWDLLSVVSNHTCHCVDISPDGQFIIGIGENPDTNMYVWKFDGLSDYNLVQTYALPTANTAEVKFSFQGTRVITTTGPFTAKTLIWSFNLTTGAMVQGAEFGFDGTQIAWSRNGEYVAFGAPQPTPFAGTVYVYYVGADIATATLIDTIDGMSGNRDALSWNRDGTVLYYSGVHLSRLQWANFSGSALTLQGSLDTWSLISQVEVSPDGTHLLVMPFQTNMAQFYSISDGGYGFGLTHVGGAATTPSGAGTARWTRFYNPPVDE